MTDRSPDPMKTDATSVVTTNPWRQLSEYTDARIGLGRAGGSLPTAPHLAFQLAHAQARDAVHLPLDTEQMMEALESRFESVVRLHSRAGDRGEYLRRPDLGRQLNERSLEQLESMNVEQCDVSIAVVDGLSARAIHEHAATLLDHLVPEFEARGWSVGPVSLVEQGRVAIGDPVGEALGARMGLVLIGERPGLSSPDSLGVYFTWGPTPGRCDSERNCISNVRPRGQSFDAAAKLILYLLDEASRREVSGVELKDDSEVDSELGDGSQGNFLLPKDQASTPE
ncbi:ethanolamine ammonia-lyase subunit EutC [Kushneria indalinina]|uniref:Ethanolamine ammonia-lyase small subunit n=1 Tax=Kushneria indalinina DSM 14324 TaxID=1122140 RepID=A0A3D9DZK8_9GAMM|nr:ethanolamine ammonia-lyase subunit EutC [Kushneria indalinina]REC96151.1 ethanolamine ammonia-lyase light chain [Kushneria indalinina DSM 14324]